MARPNYSYEKRQKELARQKKQEEKRLRKLEKRSGTADGGSDEAGIDSDSEAVELSVDSSADDASGGDD